MKHLYLLTLVFLVLAGCAGVRDGAKDKVGEKPGIEARDKATNIKVDDGTRDKVAEKPRVEARDKATNIKVDTRDTVIEPSPGPDLPPPPDYNPIFIERTAPYQSANPSMFPFITRAHLKDNKNVRLYVHIIDSNGVLFSGAKPEEWKKLICEVTVEYSGRITKAAYQLSEITASTLEPMAIAMVLDHSGSMGDQRAFALQEAARRIVSLKRPSDEIAVIKFDHRVALESPLTSSRNELLQRIQMVGLQGFGGFTAIANGAAAALNLLTSSTAPNKVVLVVTDGLDNVSSIPLDDLIAQARSQNIPICTIGFGYGIDEDYLRHLARATGGIYQRIYRTEEFDRVLPSIYMLLQYYLALDLSLTEYGVHRIRIKLCPSKSKKEPVAEFIIDNSLGTFSYVIPFDLGKSELKPESKPAIDSIEALLRANPTMIIEVRGHTDSTGSQEFNLRLSERRANAIRNELIRRGIEPDRIRAVGMGASQPIADNRTRQGRAQNRRTELIILRK
jgi:hypothetical protein